MNGRRFYELCVIFVDLSNEKKQLINITQESFIRIYKINTMITYENAYDLTKSKWRNELEKHGMVWPKKEWKYIKGGHKLILGTL